ncbi:MAG: double-strand break repair protein AddB [Alphaproteobacteria bacterium]|nr:double-strand break repair protein AddB [Alphaproteobacteria bacterium]
MTDSGAPKDKQHAAELNLYNIAAGQPFLPRLAAALLDDTHRAGLFGDCHLEDVQILLPTRRAARMLAGEMVAQAAKNGRDALLLPRIDTLGDLDEDMPDTLTATMPDDDLPPAIEQMARHFHLLPLVAAWAEKGGLGGGAGETLNPVKLSALVHDLERFLDQTQNEQAQLEKLDTLAPENLAENWQHIVSLLNIVLRYWPDQLREVGKMDPTARRNALLDRRRQNWRDTPPDYPILAAGSTGSIRATADLLTLIAGLPRGAVVLPGLDEAASPALWKAIAKDDVHPQYALAQLLEHMKTAPQAVKRFPASAPEAPRAALLNQALVPAAQTANWINVKLDAHKQTLAGLNLIEAPDIRAEAGAIALVMREVLEHDTRTAALVTRDRNLARRVSAELKRWGIDIDDSAGQPLANLPRARLLRMALQAHDTGFAPVDMLALLKHPLVCLGQSRGGHMAHVRLLENAVLRGPRPFGGLAGLRAGLSQNDRLAAQDRTAALTLLTRLETAFAPMAAAAFHQTSSIEMHLHAVLETLGPFLRENETDGDGDDETDEAAFAAQALFQNDEQGRALASLFETLSAHSPLAPDMTQSAFPAFFDMWLMRQTVRRQVPGQPRLSILGPLEARLMQADVMILGGLNETVWPPMPETGPWLSRPMRAALGMSQPERQIGQAAHDFVQAAAAPQVYLTRAEKIDGAPSVAARWLRRLETLAGDLPRDKGDALISWWQALDQTGGAPMPDSAPRPTPPTAARPRQLSVTQIETLLHNPYEIYARKILNLRALEAVDAPPNAAHRGIFLHRLMEKFIAAGHHKKPDAVTAFLDLAHAEEGRHADGAALMQFWQARLDALAFWLSDYETARTDKVKASFVEVTGKLTLGDFTLTAKADRLDQYENGGFDIIDYKTGAVPGKSQIEAHLAPQLTLEAAILRDGLFEDRRSAKPVSLSGACAALTYMKLTGRTPAAEPTAFDCSDALIDEVLDMLRRLIANYDAPSQPYLAHIRPRPRFGVQNLADTPFDHLARSPEWQDEDEA